MKRQERHAERKSDLFRRVLKAVRHDDASWAANLEPEVVRGWDWLSEGEQSALRKAFVRGSRAGGESSGVWSALDAFARKVARPSALRREHRELVRERRVARARPAR